MILLLGKISLQHWMSQISFRADILGGIYGILGGVYVVPRNNNHILAVQKRLAG